MNDNPNNISERFRDYWIDWDANQIIHSLGFRPSVGSELGPGDIRDPAINRPNESADFIGMGTELGKRHQNSGAAVRNTRPSSSPARWHQLGDQMTLELSEQMVAIIGEALSQMPYRVAAPVIAELQKQIDAQGKGARPLERAA